VSAVAVDTYWPQGHKLPWGPFILTKGENGGREHWTIELASGGKLPVHFSLKNYGGNPGPAFAGWKVVGGGPFDCFGAYESLEALMSGALTALLDYYRKHAQQKRQEAEDLVRSLDATCKEIAQAQFADACKPRN
jgi:hypothetical protein